MERGLSVKSWFIIYIVVFSVQHLMRPFMIYADDIRSLDSFPYVFTFTIANDLLLHYYV